MAGLSSELCWETTTSSSSSTAHTHSLAMPTKTFGLHQVEQVDKNTSVNRVPLEALQMLTQSVSKCNQEYIQPLPLKEEEQKKSPLALLAATCSSIGKAEPTKTTETLRDNSSISSKISSDETKSSFKPYKQSPEKEEEMKDKSGFRSPSSKANSPLSSPSETKEERNKGSQYGDSDSHCGYVHSQQSRIQCGIAVEPSQGQTMHSLHKDCGGNCTHPSTLIPFKGSTMPYPAPLPSPEQAALKSHGIPTSNVSSIYPQCACVFCTPHGENAAAQALTRPLHGPATPYIDYLQRTICRDANCTNCRTPISPYGLPPAVQQCGPHCMQCESKPTDQSSVPYPCYYPAHSLAMFKAPQEEGHPYVCNWVSGAKHCGKSFATSEDLFQHLRTHTQLSNNSVSPPLAHTAASPCTIHGCPCKLQQSPVQSSFHTSRYRPYYFKPSLIPGPTPASINCYSASPYASLHSLAYDPHRLFK